MESDDLQSGWDGVTKAGVLRALKKADPGWDLKGAEKERARQRLKRENRLGRGLSELQGLPAPAEFVRGTPTPRIIF